LTTDARRHEYGPRRHRHAAPRRPRSCRPPGALLPGQLGVTVEPQVATAPEKPRSPLQRLYPALGAPAFRMLWLGMLPSTLAWQLNAVASGYAAFVLSDSATTLGIVSIASGLPVLALSLVGGVVADRFPRRAVLLLAQSTFAVATGAVAAAALAGRLQVWHLGGLGLVQGVAMSFNIPARQAYIAELVGPHLLRNAVALNNAGMNGCRIVGPALAGALLAMPAIGIGGVFGLMTAMYAAVLLLLLQLPAPSAADAK